MQEFVLGTRSESWSALGGHKLVGQAANLTLSPPLGCYRPNIHLHCVGWGVKLYALTHPSTFVLLLSHTVDTHLPSLGG